MPVLGADVVDFEQTAFPKMVPAPSEGQTSSHAMPNEYR